MPPERDYTERAVRTVIEKHLAKFDTGERARKAPREFARAVQATALHFQRHVEQAARDLVVDAVDPELTELERARSFGRFSIDEFVAYEPPAEPDDAEGQLQRGQPIGWARVPSGAESCPFCVMLASRGAVYQSKETAAAFKHETKQGHNACDCRIVPVWNKNHWEGKEQANALYEKWLEVANREEHPDQWGAWRSWYEKQAAEGHMPALPAQNVRSQGPGRRSGVGENETDSMGLNPSAPWPSVDVESLPVLPRDESWERSVATVNPGYPQAGFTRNCTNAVLALELRQRNRDVVALPLTDGRMDDEWLAPLGCPVLTSETSGADQQSCYCVEMFGQTSSGLCRKCQKARVGLSASSGRSVSLKTERFCKTSTLMSYRARNKTAC